VGAFLLPLPGVGLILGNPNDASSEESVKMFWAVAIGAAAGGVCRYYLGAFVQQNTGATFPYGTMVINITGSLVLGFLLRYALTTQTWSVEFRALLTTGFCGGYTTFSTYSYETAMLMEDGEYRRAATYAFGSVVAALAATFLGFVLARELITWRERF
jgi:fluoride exporter